MSATLLQKDGDTVRVDFLTRDSDGITTAADSTPSGSLLLNGATNANAVTVTQVSGGLYTATFTAPGAAGNTLTLKLAATVGGLTTEDVLTIRLVAADVTDAVRLGLTALPNAAFNATGGLGAGVIRGGTAQAGSNLSITLDSGASSVDSFYRGRWIAIVGGTGAGQVKLCTTYTGSTKIATIPTAWPTNPDNTSVFAILPNAAVDVGMWLNSSVAATSQNGVPKVDVGYFGGSAGTFASGIPTTNLSAAVYQVIAKEIYGTAGTVWFVSTSGNDTTGNGLTWATAYATLGKAATVASAGDFILLGSGTFDEIGVRVAIPDGVSVKGAGMSRTKIIWSSDTPSGNGVMFRPGSNASVEDLEIDGANQSYPVGAIAGYQAAVVNAALRRVRITGSYDGLYFDHISNLSTSVFRIGIALEDCEVTTTYDCVAVFGQYATSTPFVTPASPVAGSIALRNCRVFTRNVGSNPARGICSLEAGVAATPEVFRIEVSGGSIEARDGTGETHAAHVDAGAYVVLDNVVMRTSAASGTISDVKQIANASSPAGGSVRAMDCVGSGTGGTLSTSGTVTVAQALRPATAGQTIIASYLDAPISDVPTAAENATAGAAAVLTDPTKKLVTDSDGKVTTSNPATQTTRTVTDTERQIYDNPS